MTAHATEPSASLHNAGEQSNALARAHARDGDGEPLSKGIVGSRRKADQNGAVMETVLGSSLLILGLVLLWTGRRRLEVSSYLATLISILELVSFVVLVIALGWIGIAILLAVNAAAVVVRCVVLYSQKQAMLVNASVQAADVGMDELEAIWQWMRRNRRDVPLSPLARAKLIRALAIQARQPTEIRDMSAPIAQLAIAFECEPEWLAPRFDQLLRLHGKPASEASGVADTLTRGTQLAAASFEEMIEAMLASAAAVESKGSQPEADSDRQDDFEENLRANAELQIRQAGEQGVRLNCGPMDGWFVKPDAPSLKNDWHRTWPPGLARRHAPGRYELGKSEGWATWIPLRE